MSLVRCDEVCKWRISGKNARILLHRYRVVKSRNLRNPPSPILNFLSVLNVCHSYSFAVAAPYDDRAYTI